MMNPGLCQFSDFAISLEENETIDPIGASLAFSRLLPVPRTLVAILR